MININWVSSVPESRFWQAVAKVARRAGTQIVEKCLMLFYTARHPATPKWARRTIYGALVYFLIPFDAIPDFIPVVGFTDDLAALTAALGAVMMYLTPEIKEYARQKAQMLFNGELFRESEPA